MAIQDDNTIVTKGDLKALYTDKIAPYLGANMMMSTNNSDYYSTDEKVVGVWMDGKPLYQKTFTGSTASSAYNWVQVPIGASIDFARLVDLTILAGGGGGTNATVDFFYPSVGEDLSAYARAVVWTDRETSATSKNRLGIYTKFSGAIPYVATIQYTKTTDAAGSATTTPGAYDINFPNTWPENTEIFFGNGLYGYRKTGSGSGVGPTNIGAFGGLTKNGHLMSHGGHLQASNGGNWDTGYFAVEIDNTVTIDQTWSTGSISFTYNLWVTYTK